MIWILALLFLAILIGWAIGRMDMPPQRPAEQPPTASSGMSSGLAPGAGAAPGAAELSQWTTYDAAMDESRRSGKPIMLDFNAEWCGPCQALKSDVFDDHSRGEVVRSVVIPVSITDRTREEGHNPPQIDELQQRYQIDAFPTLVVFSPASGRSQETKGFGYGDATLQWIEHAAKSVK